MRDLYSILEVPRSASQDDIKKAYRRLAKELHPDHNPNDRIVADRFKEVSSAYKILGDIKQRGRYDRGEIDGNGNQRARGGPGGFNAGGFDPGQPQGGHRAGARRGSRAREESEFFRQFGFEGAATGGGPEDIFSDLFGQGRRERPNPFTERGADRTYAIRIGFLDSARGTKRRITLPSGKTLDVKIPAGIDSGQQIRLKGQGEAGPHGAPAGDALIEVNVDAHAFFTRKGDDIHLDLPITLPEAVLGSRIRVPTIDGMVNLSVPKGSNSGTVLRLKEKGVPGDKAQRRGDQYVKLIVTLPDTADAELEKLIRKWGKDGEYEVRRRFVVD
ncbi:MAG: J domain-containing protein [Sneathiellaceae bacterium]